MPISDFCAQYGLSTGVLNKLTTNSFIHTCSLRFVQTEDLGTIGFLLGKVAEIKDAVERWEVLSLQQHILDFAMTLCTFAHAEPQASFLL
jgi:hypothetical protein